MEGHTIREVTLRDYRCFHMEQSARLAPLTFLVGDNSTGKTSFLAAIRVLQTLKYGEINFKEEPYDLGSYDEISHHRGSRGSRADNFEIGLSVAPIQISEVLDSDGLYTYNVTFTKSGSSPEPSIRLTTSEGITLRENFKNGLLSSIEIETKSGQWEAKPPNTPEWTFRDAGFFLPPPEVFLRWMTRHSDDIPSDIFQPIGSSPELSSVDWHQIIEHCNRTSPYGFMNGHIYASAPVRSRPRRTYDPEPYRFDPGGGHMPMQFANLYYQDRRSWAQLKDQMEKFGHSSGLFDEIDIRPLGKNESEPFQIHVRKFGNNLKGPTRNLIDMGYGVSQVLPVLADLSSRNVPDLFLLQQPEVHLHPSAQAALGTLFCQHASQGRQLIVETHSDYLVDRVRMEIRDGLFDLDQDDVSILYFEKTELDTTIHSIRIDEQGQPINPPKGYRNFFLRERERLLGF